MRDTVDIQRSFFDSTLLKDSDTFSNKEFTKWLDNKRENNTYQINEIDFASCEKWKLSETSGFIEHDSGKFFQIIGLNISTNFGHVPSWNQPIINQAEIGILGLLTKIIKGTRHFLVQIKMEPGNIDLVQISPTLQATKSNFTQVHKGKKPKYLEYFQNHPAAEVLIDQLQIEQSGRFLKKRNRNMIIEVNEDIPEDENFRWLTLGQIKELLKADNIINMDTRTVISCISYIELFKSNYVVDALMNYSHFDNDVKGYIQSIIHSDRSIHSDYQILSWITEMKTFYEVKLEIVPLSHLKDWIVLDNTVKHRESDYFEITPFEIDGGQREVNSWCQPLVKDLSLGLIGFLVTTINGVFHFLVQGKVEPGSIDTIDLCPTVSCSNFQKYKNPEDVPFLSEFVKTSTPQTMFDSLQSEEGGRFFQVQNRYMIVYDNDLYKMSLPLNYKWMTLGQMLEFLKHGYFNIEGRSLISCINLI